MIAHFLEWIENVFMNKSGPTICIEQNHVHSVDPLSAHFSCIMFFFVCVCVCVRISFYFPGALNLSPVGEYSQKLFLSCINAQLT